AAREFAQVGYEAASINRVLESVGLSKGAFYYYFDDKADLAATVMQWAYRDLFAVYDRITIPEDGAKFWDAIYEFARESLSLLQRAPYSNELFSRLSQAFVNDKELADRLTELTAKPVRTFAGVLERGQQLGAVRSDLPVATLMAVFQGVKEALVRAGLPGGQAPTAADLERLVHLQIDLFRRVAAPAAPEDPR
ncbi:MAG: TetR family transcriptional regulator, partial [Acidobacteria bacterium]